MKYLLFFLLLILASCSSAKKSAIKLTEQGKHEDALAQWTEAYRKDPDDEEVIEGLRQCQESILNDRLVKVRDLRLAKNDEEAIKKLKSVVAFQKNHDFKLDINSSSFQGKETAMLWPYQRSKITDFISRERPLAAEFRLKSFDDVFHTMSESQTLATQIKDLGAKQCLTLKKAKKERVFYLNFVGQFCQHYLPTTTVESKISAQLFGGPLFQIYLRNTSEEMQGIFEKKLSEAFSQSPWFHAESKTLSQTKINGEFSHSLDVDNVRLNHGYTEQVPYTAYETVTKQRSVPYSAREVVCSSGVCKPESVTKYRNESYREKEAVTKYRDVQRVHKYYAQKHQQEFALIFSGAAEATGSDIPLSFSKNDQESWTTHDENIPRINLYPLREKGTSPKTKFSEYAQLAANDYKKDLDLSWKNKFCVLPPERTMIGTGEAIIKCHRLKEYPRFFVDPWFMDHFAVTADEAESLVGKF